MPDPAAAEANPAVSRSGDRDPSAAALFPPPAGAGAPAATPWWRRLLGLAGWMLGGGVAGFGIAAFGSSILDGLPRGGGLALLAGFLVGLWPHIVIHEAGHALAGLSRGMQAVAFGVGPFRAERGGDGRWRWRNGGGIRGIGGFAALLPRGERGLSTTDQVVFVLGGPLANLLTAAACIGVARLLAGTPLLALALLGVAMGALLLGLANLLPFRTHGWRSDGRGLLDLLRGAPDAALQLRVNQLMAMSMAGVRPRDWPDALLPAVDDADRSPLLALVARLLRLSVAVDRRDAAPARALAGALAATFARAPDVYRPSVAIALAGYAALLPRDRALLAAWRAHCDGGLLDLSPYRAWLDGELALLDGDPAAALGRLADARALQDRIPDAASLLLFREYLDQLDSRIGGDAGAA
ncbi:hypothetical protein LDO26_12740 [Luteimonas sp. BDR2-5]|uniref:hypothetical protein n=1 Tax=Proluteimonas luteida TaxID=2878685 RepID=UPI001E623792|nr:hypothetical protein [Luteimonas sp. BDR2-5]MCD9029068.1 hypothetical protein [Luteimonas sp. BDR2-5]